MLIAKDGLHCFEDQPAQAVQIRFRLPEEQPDRPIPGAFIAGGFPFDPGSIVSEVPYDPELYFYGEKVAMSARLWTSDFNIYAPNHLLLFHLYKTERTYKEHSATRWTITAIDTIATFAQSNAYTHFLVVSTPPRLNTLLQ